MTISPQTAVLSQLRFKHLRLIDILARTGNLHRAADELNVTQPAASKILQVLEDLRGRGLRDIQLVSGAMKISGARQNIDQPQMLEPELGQYRGLGRDGHGDADSELKTPKIAYHVIGRPSSLGPAAASYSQG